MGLITKLNNNNNKYKWMILFNKFENIYKLYKYPTSPNFYFQ